MTNPTSKAALLCATVILFGCASVRTEAGTEAKKKTERKGPLAKLPGKPGAHIAKIKAMGDNTWLDLGVVPPDPRFGEAIGRSWSSTMPYAPELRGAFLYGEGRHGGTTLRNGKRYYNDDLFFYDVNANKWVCVYPGMQVGTYNLTVNKDGFEVNAQGHPVPVAPFVHSYRMITYDTHRKMFVHMWSPSGYWRKPFPKRVALISKNSNRLNGLGRGWSKIGQASPWMYDTVAGHWRRLKTRARTPRLGHGSHLIYLPPQKKFFLLGTGGTSTYDPAKNDWAVLKPTGPRPPKPIDAASCYDPKRQRIYVAMGSYPKNAVKGTGNRVWSYDVQKNTWSDLKAKGQLPPRPGGVSGCGISRMHYDSANDVILYLAFAPRGFYAYSAEKNEWTLATDKFPESWGKNWRRCSHSFYDPVLNAHFIYKAGDSKGGGKMRVYRYKRAGRK